LKRFTIIFALTVVVVFSLLAFMLIFIDPYNSGRVSILAGESIRAQGPRTAHAFRGRNPRFEGVIIGNSHIQLLSPERLSAQTGVAFVSLTVPGTGPKEQLVLLDWFLRHRKTTPKVVIIGSDGYWCTHDPHMPNWKPFPFWLYNSSWREYLTGLMSLNTLEEAVAALRHRIHPRNPARLDGYWDYEKDYHALSEATGAGGEQPNLENRKETISPNISGQFPAIEALRDVIKVLPKSTGVFLVRPPVYVTGLPKPESAEAKTDAACLQALYHLATTHQQLSVLDWRMERPETSNKALFFDHTHYRQGLAIALEEQISALIKVFRLNDKR
jgi:hypothetical protein